MYSFGFLTQELMFACSYDAAIIHTHIASCKLQQIEMVRLQGIQNPNYT